MTGEDLDVILAAERERRAAEHRQTRVAAWQPVPAPMLEWLLLALSMLACFAVVAGLA